MIKDIILRNRSYRRFYQNEPVAMETLRELVNLARLSASGANLQPLRYILSCDPERNNQIFQHLAWAGYLKDWPGPEEGERPSAYIIILGDTRVSKTFGCDHGIAAQSILLGAAEQGLGGCMIGSVKRADLAQTLNIDPSYEILLAIALGRPKEVVQIEAMGKDGNVRYWRDENQVHHVPKRALQDIIIE